MTVPASDSLNGPNYITSTDAESGLSVDPHRHLFYYSVDWRMTSPPSECRDMRVQCLYFLCHVGDRRDQLVSVSSIRHKERRVKKSVPS